jgi:hypothetical protein
MFLISYGFHDPSLNKSLILFLIPSSIVTSRGGNGYFISRIAFNPIMCSNFSLCFVAELQMDDFSEYKISFTVFLVSVFRNNGLWDHGNGFVGRGLCRHFYLTENACIL